jgi:hypothetical protein
VEPPEIAADFVQIAWFDIPIDGQEAVDRFLTDREWPKFLGRGSCVP